MTTFLEALESHKDEAPPHVQRVLGMRKGNRKTRILERMRAHVCTHFGMDPDAQIDWSKQLRGTGPDGDMKAWDWSTLFAFLEQILPAILALFKIFL